MATDKLVDFDHVTDYISREAVEQIICEECGRLGCPDGGCDMYRRLKRLPAADVVVRDCYDRILAENDTMREMLAQIGKKPGDKMDDVLTVVRCVDCVHLDPETSECRSPFGLDRPNFSCYCSGGRRKQSDR